MSCTTRQSQWKSITIWSFGRVRILVQTLQIMMKKQKFFSCFWQQPRSLLFKDVSLLRQHNSLSEYTELAGVAKNFLASLVKPSNHTTQILIWPDPTSQENYGSGSPLMLGMFLFVRSWKILRSGCVMVDSAVFQILNGGPRSLQLLPVSQIL